MIYVSKKRKRTRFHHYNINSDLGKCALKGLQHLAQVSALSDGFPLDYAL